MIMIIAVALIITMVPVQVFAAFSETTLQQAVAKAVAADYIVTRNLKDYKQSPVPAILPEQLCAMF